MGCGASTNAPPNESEEYPRYAKIMKGHEALIKGLFQKLDADGDEYLVASELKDVVSKYTGEAFDEKSFFQWFDVHGAAGLGGEGAGPDSKLDLKEFGWYLADTCEGFDNPLKAMPTVVEKFEKIIAGGE